MKKFLAFLFLLPLVSAFNFPSGSQQQEFNFPTTQESISGDCPVNYVMMGINEDGTLNCVLVNIINTSYYLLSNPNNYLNVTINTSYYLTSNPQGFITWYNATNGSLLTLAQLLGFNYFNSTFFGGIGNWSNDRGNYSTYSNQTSTFLFQSSANANYSTNDLIYRNWTIVYGNYSTYPNQTSTFRQLNNNSFTGNGTIIGNWNVTSGNISVDANKPICLEQTCSKYILWNSTDSTIRIHA